MQELVGRLTALDPEASENLKVIAYFDALVEGHAALDVLLRGAAVLTGCAAGLAAGGKRMRVDERGLRATDVGSPRPVWAERPDGEEPAAGAADTEGAEASGGVTVEWPRRPSGYGDGFVWIEREGAAHANDAMVLERLAIAVGLSLERSDPAAGERRALEVLLDGAEPVESRAAAARRLQLDERSLLRIVARPAGHSRPEPRSAVIVTAAGRVRATLHRDGDGIASSGPASSGTAAGASSASRTAASGTAAGERLASSGSATGTGSGSRTAASGTAAGERQASSGSATGTGSGSRTAASGTAAGERLASSGTATVDRTTASGTAAGAAPASRTAASGVRSSAARASAAEVAGIGVAATAVGLDESWQTALIALKMTGPLEPVVRADELGVVLLAARMSEAAEPGRPAHPDVAAIGRAIGRDPKALDAFDALVHSESVRSAAALLGVHHSTLQARTAELSEALGFDLRTSAGRVRLSDALRLHRLATAWFDD
ncbi:helix-turn-helix domain-containing protein [Herbiconiux sp. 11R-BC]|uniref:helix-turn-helix domain-containing protein n=1 Tax=Herbiconiux sp. 11R-BC TaxID=3111637 RepID=UPI003C0E9CF8